jgi:hypothetical protein
MGMKVGAKFCRKLYSPVQVPKAPRIFAKVNLKRLPSVRAPRPTLVLSLRLSKDTEKRLPA